jgi:hypothetical protein
MCMRRCRTIDQSIPDSIPLTQPSYPHRNLYLLIGRGAVRGRSLKMIEDMRVAKWDKRDCQ